MDGIVIISASRRTDIPAFFSGWFMNRLRAGWCAVPNPFNASQVSRVPLGREDVDAFVFWTRYCRPLLPHLPELDDQGFPSLFQYTVVDYPRELDRNSPPLAKRLEAACELAAHIGPARIVWRYDPIVVSAALPLAEHVVRFERLASLLEGCASRCVVSFLEQYAKTRRRFAPLAGNDWEPVDPPDRDKAGVVRELAAIAEGHGMAMAACCQPWREGYPVVPASACIDGGLLEELFGIPCPGTKDAGQRPLCNCAPSRDIGMYDSCRFGCRYCYATASREAAWRNRLRHAPDSPSLLGRAAPLPPSGQAKLPGIP